jgi:trehalose-6-phosphate synthase
MDIMKVENNIYKWKYIPQKPTEDAYESIIDEIRELGKNYLISDDSAKETIIETIFSKIREINIFPVIYFSEEGIKNEILEMYNKADVCFVEGGVYT